MTTTSAVPGDIVLISLPGGDIGPARLVSLGSVVHLVETLSLSRRRISVPAKNATVLVLTWNPITGNYTVPAVTQVGAA